MCYELTMGLPGIQLVLTTRVTVRFPSDHPLTACRRGWIGRGWIERVDCERVD